MFEKVNPSHPDKVADRIAGAIVDLAYKTVDNPRIAVEVLLGHEVCFVVIESPVLLFDEDIHHIVHRIAGDIRVDIISADQDVILAGNQSDIQRCGDNGIFKGVPVSGEENFLSELARLIYRKYPYDGKYLIGKTGWITICQSHATEAELKKVLPIAIINPLGYWEGGINVDTGATNRKLGSDMGRAATGGGLHGKDLTKADVTLNIYAHLKAQELKEPVELSCSIGDSVIDGKPYSELIEIARKYIEKIGGFEKFAEWGLI